MESIKADQARAGDIITHIAGYEIKVNKIEGDTLHLERADGSQLDIKVIKLQHVIDRGWFEIVRS